MADGREVMRRDETFGGDRGDLADARPIYRTQPEAFAMGLTGAEELVTVGRRELVRQVAVCLTDGLIYGNVGEVGVDVNLTAV